MLVGAKPPCARCASASEAGLDLADALYAIRADLFDLIATKFLTPSLLRQELYSSLVPFLPLSAKRVEMLREYKH